MAGATAGLAKESKPRSWVLAHFKPLVLNATCNFKEKVFVEPEALATATARDHGSAESWLFIRGLDAKRPTASAAFNLLAAHRLGSLEFTSCTLKTASIQKSTALGFL